MRLEQGKTYKTADGSKVAIVAQMPPDANACCFVGTVAGNGSLLFTIDGTCPADSQKSITGLWVSDHTLYQPMKVREDGSAIILADIYGDKDQLKAKYPGITQIAEIACVDGVITVTKVS